MFDINSEQAKMIPRLILAQQLQEKPQFRRSDYGNIRRQSSAMRLRAAVNNVSVICLVLLATLLPAKVHSFFHNQENVIAPINSAGLLINQLLVNTANVSSLLDQNIDHIKPSVGDYPTIEERSDYYGSEFAVRAFNCI